MRKDSWNIYLEASGTVLILF